MFDKALTFGGWPGLILLLGGNALGTAAWLGFVVTRRYRPALYTWIMMFPFSFYAGRAAGIRAFSIPDWDQDIGLTTTLLLLLFGVLLFTGRIRRIHGGFATSVEVTLWIFAIAVTGSQFATHDPKAAALLSVGAVWQFVALFYLIASLIVRDVDLIHLLNAVFVFSLLNILVRVVAKGESLIVNLSSPTAGDAAAFGSEAGRVGSGALGSAMSYAGYLAMLITLGLGVFFLTRRKVYIIYVAAMFVELLNTFTRGGLFVLTLLLLLVFFRFTRRATLAIALPLAAIVGVGWSVIVTYASFRGFSLNVMDVGNFSLRVELLKRYLATYQFSWTGNGILQATMIELAPWLIVPVHNAYVEILDTCGALSFAAFIVLSFILLVTALRSALSRPRASLAHVPSVGLAPFVLIALLQWIVYANTTSTSILAYYPYEGTAVFWLVAFMPLLCLSIRRRARMTLNASPQSAAEPGGVRRRLIALEDA